MYSLWQKKMGGLSVGHPQWSCVPPWSARPMFELWCMMGQSHCMLPAVCHGYPLGKYQVMCKGKYILEVPFMWLTPIQPVCESDASLFTEWDTPGMSGINLCIYTGWWVGQPVSMRLLPQVVVRGKANRKTGIYWLPLILTYFDNVGLLSLYHFHLLFYEL